MWESGRNIFKEICCKKTKWFGDQSLYERDMACYEIVSDQKENYIIRVEKGKV